MVVSNSAYDFTDGLFIVDNIISGTTDSALYLALRYDGLTITGNRIDGIGIDGNNPQKAAAIYIRQDSSKLSPAFVERILNDPGTSFVTTPQNTLPLGTPGQPSYNSRALIDACRPYERLADFPAVAEASDEVLSRVARRWPGLAP